jgi:hypothetical protein
LYENAIITFAAVKAKRKTTTNDTTTAAAEKQLRKQQQQQHEQLCASLLEGLEAHCRLPASHQLLLIDDGGGDCRLQLFLSTAASLAVSLEQMVEFAKHVPGFLALPSLLQLGLVKANILKLVLLCDLLLTTAADSTSPSPFMNFLDGRYLSLPQAEALFSREFVERYRRLKERHCTAGSTAAAVEPAAVALMGAGLLLEIPPATGGNPDQNCDADNTTVRGLAGQISAAATSVFSPAAADFEWMTSQFLPNVMTIANEMLEFFKIFQSFCDVRQLPPVFVEVFDF